MKGEDILQIIKRDPWMMKVLEVARDLNLPDWMIGAGFVRNKVWDHLHGYKNEEVPTADVDLIFYDPNDLSKDREKEYDQKLRESLSINWSTKNQARMHENHNKQEQYRNSEEALSEWVETPTCVAVRLNKNDELTLSAPHGIDDLVNLIVRPSPTFSDNLEIFWERVKSKEWQQKWPKLTVLEH